VRLFCVECWLVRLGCLFGFLFFLFFFFCSEIKEMRLCQCARARVKDAFTAQIVFPQSEKDVLPN